MKLLVNNEWKELERPATPSVDAILEELALENRKGIAVALNSKVIPRHRWHESMVEEDDSLLIIKATQGG